MKRTLSAFAALTLLAGIGALPAAAADYDDDYSYKHSRSYNQNPPRVDYNYDEDNGGYGRRGHHGHGWGHNRTDRVEARASYASDYMPYHVKEWRAKASAIDVWKNKVSRLYGERLAHWRSATDKQVNCDAGAGAVYCTVSARPAEGYSRWGWWNDERAQSERRPRY